MRSISDQFRLDSKCDPKIFWARRLHTDEALRMTAAGAPLSHQPCAIRAVERVGVVQSFTTVDQSDH
jgi:hypothetical protein